MNVARRHKQTKQKSNQMCLAGAKTEYLKKKENNNKKKPYFIQNHLAPLAAILWHSNTLWGPESYMNGRSAREASSYFNVFMHYYAPHVTSGVIPSDILSDQV